MRWRARQARGRKETRLQGCVLWFSTQPRGGRSRPLHPVARRPHTVREWLRNDRRGKGSFTSITRAHLPHCRAATRIRSRSRCLSSTMTEANADTLRGDGVCPNSHLSRAPRTSPCATLGTPCSGGETMSKQLVSLSLALTLTHSLDHCCLRAPSPHECIADMTGGSKAASHDRRETSKGAKAVRPYNDGPYG